jgi:MFS superfamily sulfate permease-like transporter
VWTSRPYLSRAETGVVWLIVLFSFVFGLMQAVGLGLLMACLLFIATCASRCATRTRCPAHTAAAL